MSTVLKVKAINVTLIDVLWKQRMKSVASVDNEYNELINFKAT